ncbi:SMP-30/gluconolactonase/LRE family protein [Novosphingobium panipatense]|uniref:SMP-30/gluconolactonase/LRE family protein n=1 Tax=Novosphingobium panipatense TaxID=428991 RepID=UPI0036108D0F
MILLADIGFSNGIMFDAGRNRFYCNDTFRGTWAFDVSADLLLSNRRLVLEKEDADGMALDVDGNVWITGFRSSAFTRLTSGGSELAPYPGAAGSITQLRFGGEDMRDMYFNVVPADGGDTLKVGKYLRAALLPSSWAIGRSRNEVATYAVQAGVNRPAASIYLPDCFMKRKQADPPALQGKTGEYPDQSSSLRAR